MFGTRRKLLLEIAFPGIKFRVFLRKQLFFSLYRPMLPQNLLSNNFSSFCLVKELMSVINKPKCLLILCGVGDKLRRTLRNIL